MALRILIEAINHTLPAFDAITDNINAVKASVNQLSKSFSVMTDDIGKSMTNAKESIAGLKTPIKDDANTLSTAFADPAKDAERQLAKIADGLDNISKVAKQEAKTIETAFKNPSEDAAKQLTNIAEGLDNLPRQIKADAEVLETAFNQPATKAVDAIKPIATELNTITKSMKEVAETARKSFDDAADAAKPFNDQLKVMADKSKSKETMQKGMGEPKGILSNDASMNLLFGGMTAEAIAMPFVEGFSTSIGAFADFDQAVANVNSMMGKSQEEVELLKDELIKLSQMPNMSDSPTELADALYSIVGAGVNASKAMNFLKTTAQAGVAGQTDAINATNALVFSLNAYGAEANEVTKYADIMFAANASGAMTFEQFTRSMGTVVAPAAQAGVSFEQVAAATAALTNKGLSAQRATQNLRALLMGIVAPTDKAKESAEALGIQWDEAALKQKGLLGLLTEAMTVTGGNTEKLRGLLPNIAAYTAATALAGEGGTVFKNALEAMNNSAGATLRALSAQEEGLSEQTHKMNSAIETAKITFTESFAPAITVVVEKVTELARWFAQLSPETHKTIAIVAALTGGFFAVSGAIMMFLSGIGQAFMGVTAITQAFPGLGAAISGLLNPWFLLGVAIVAGIVLIISNWDKITNWVRQNFGVDIPAMWNSFVAITSSVWQSVSKVFVDVWNTIENVVTKVLNYISTTIVGALEKIKLFWNNNWDSIKTIFTFVWESIKTVFNAVWGVISVFLELHMERIKLIFTVFFDALKILWSVGWETLKAILKTAWDLIVGVIRIQFDLITGIISIALDLLTGKWGKAWEDLKNTVTTLIKDVKILFGQIASNAYTWGKNVIKSFVDGMKDMYKDVKSAVTGAINIVKDFMGFHSPTKEGPGTESDTWAPNFVKMFAEGLTNGIPTIKAASSELMKPMSDSIKNLHDEQIFRVKEITSLGQQIINAKKLWVEASKRGDEVAMSKASDSANKYRDTLTQLGVDASTLGRDVSLSDAMTALQRFTTDATQKANTEYTNMAVGLTSRSSAIKSAISTTTSDMSADIKRLVNISKIDFDSMANNYSGMSANIISRDNQISSSLGTLTTEFANDFKAINGSVENNVIGIIELLKTLGTTTDTIFQSISLNMVESMKKSITEIKGLFGTLLSSVISDTTALNRTISTISTAMKSPSNYSANVQQLTPLASYSSGSSPLRPSAIGSVVNQITVNASGNITKSEKELADKIQIAILDKMKQQGKFS